MQDVDTRTSENDSLPDTEDDLEKELSKNVGAFKHIRIAKRERPRVLCFSVLLSFIVLIHSIIGNMRDMALVDRQEPASIFFIKSLFLLPCSWFLIRTVRAGLRTFSLSTMFDIALIIFACYYAAFGLVMWPFKEHIQKDFHWVRDIFNDEKMKPKRLEFMYPMLLVFNEWVTSVFFLSSEIWGCIIVSYFFSTFANEASTKRQTHRYISVYNIFNSLSILASSLITFIFNVWRDSVPFKSKEFGFRILVLALAFMVAGTLIFKKYMERSILHIPVFLNASSTTSDVKKTENFNQPEEKPHREPKFLLAMSSVTLLYGVSSTLIEMTFKSGVFAGAKHTNSSKETYSNFYNSVEQLATSFLSILITNTSFPMLSAGRGWIYVAILPVLAVLSSLLFVFPLAFYNTTCLVGKSVLFHGLSSGWRSNFFLENNLGLATFVFLKVGKLTGLDIAKEAISMQINPLYRARCKAMYSGMSEKTGKSIGSILCNAMIMVWDVTDIRKLAVILWPLIAAISILWVYILMYLERIYRTAINSNSYIHIDIDDSS